MRHEPARCRCPTVDDRHGRRCQQPSSSPAGLLPERRRTSSCYTTQSRAEQSSPAPLYYSLLYTTHHRALYCGCSHAPAWPAAARQSTRGGTARAPRSRAKPAATQPACIGNSTGKCLSSQPPHKLRAARVHHLTHATLPPHTKHEASASATRSQRFAGTRSQRHTSTLPPSYVAYRLPSCARAAEVWQHSVTLPQTHGIGQRPLRRGHLYLQRSRSPRDLAAEDASGNAAEARAMHAGSRHALSSPRLAAQGDGDADLLSANGRH
jgi:hypothetical protein